MFEHCTVADFKIFGLLTLRYIMTVDVNRSFTVMHVVYYFFDKAIRTGKIFHKMQEMTFITTLTVMPSRTRCN